MELIELAVEPLRKGRLLLEVDLGKGYSPRSDGEVGERLSTDNLGVEDAMTVENSYSFRTCHAQLSD